MKPMLKASLLSAILIAFSVRLIQANVIIDYYAGDNFDPFIANSTGTGQDGYYVAVAAGTIDAAKAYDKAYIQSVFSGSTVDSDTTSTQSGTAGSMIGQYNGAVAQAGNQIYMVVLNAGTTGNTSTTSVFGVYTSSDWTFPTDGNTETITTSDGNWTSLYGERTGTTATDTVRTYSAVSAGGSMYWDSDGSTNATIGGSGTWQSAGGNFSTTNDNSRNNDGTWDFETGGNTFKPVFEGSAGTVTVSGTVNTAHGMSVDASSGNYTFTGGTINFTGANAATNSINIAEDVTIASAITAGNGISKDGAGTLTLSGTFSDDIVVNTGTLLLGAEQTNIGSITMAGGTMLSLDGYDFTASDMTLTGNTTLNFGNSDSKFSIGGLDLGNNTLTVWNWNGDPWSGGGAEQFILTGGISNGDIHDIVFYSDEGTTLWANQNYFPKAQELTPAVPEPSTMICGVLLLGIISWRERKRLKTLVAGTEG